MELIYTSDAPPPRGHYSQAVSHGGFVFVSGQLPIGDDGEILNRASAGDQARAVMRNIGKILDAAGSGLDRLVSVTIYVTDIDFWPEVNEAYIEVVGAHRPARAVIPVKELHAGVILEAQAIAAT